MVAPALSPTDLDRVEPGTHLCACKVFGTEYTFSNDGVMNHQPRETGDPNCTFRVGVVLGKLQGMTRRDVEQIVYSLKVRRFTPVGCDVPCHAVFHASIHHRHSPDRCVCVCRVATLCQVPTA